MKARDVGMLVLLAAVWGASFLFIRIAAPVLGPLVLVDARVTIAGVVLLCYAVLVRQMPAFRTQWRAFLILGALNAAMPFLLIAQAVIHLNASLAAILNATTPLFTAVVAAWWLKEPLTARQAYGLILGIIGVAILVGWSPLPLTLPVILAAGASLIGALCYAIGGVYAKRTFQDTPPLALSIGQQLGAGILLLPLAMVSPPPTWPTLTVIWAVVGLALLSTAFAYLLYFRLIGSIGPTKTLTVTFLVPVFGLIWGMLILDEPVNLGMLGGLGVILASVLLVTGVRFLPARAIPLGQADQTR